MAEHLWKFKSGIYPVVPGQTMELGDYGYWNDSQWCRVGNITQIQGMPIELSIKEHDLDQLVKEQHHVRLQGITGAEGNAGDIEAQGSLIFENKHSQFYFGKLKKCRYYCSIDQEILPYLRKLHEAGIWKRHYWLAYYIVESDRFFTFRSIDSGAEVHLRVNLSEATLNESLNLASMFSSGLASVEEVSSLGNGMKYAGAKFISLEKKYLLFGEKIIKYNYGEEDDLFP